MTILCLDCGLTAAEADDVEASEGGCGEEPGPQGGDHHRGGAHKHTEEVLSRHPRAQLLLPGQGRLVQRAKPHEHNDGATQVLQPPVSSQRSALSFLRTNLNSGGMWKIII